MNEPLILERRDLAQPAAEAMRSRPAPVSNRFRTDKARISFQPVDQLLARLDRAKPMTACA
jgi:hypothetical protein